MTDSRPALFLVRHAQGSLGTGDYDRLSATGFRQAEILGRYLQRELGCASLVRGGLRRIDEAARRLDALLATSNVVVAVTSAGVISTMAAQLLEADLAWQRRLNVTLYNASVTELRLGTGGRWKPARINCVNHLPPGELHTLA